MSETSVDTVVDCPTIDAPGGVQIKTFDPLKLKPIDARVIIELLTPADRSEGGIYLPPKAAQDKATALARVVTVGSGRITEQGVTIPIRVKKDDVVLIGKFAGTPLNREGTIKLINEIEILCEYPNY